MKEKPLYVYEFEPQKPVKGWEAWQSLTIDELVYCFEANQYVIDIYGNKIMIVGIGYDRDKKWYAEGNFIEYDNYQCQYRIGRLYKWTYDTHCENIDDGRLK